jgi:methyl-accepting chemotaxis protein
VQEWKDLLLRGHTPADKAHYLPAFEAKEKAVQEQLAILHGQLAGLGQPTGQVDAVVAEHRKLGALYREALALWKDGDDLTYRTVDSKVRGKDRPLAEMMKPLRESLDQAMEDRRKANITEAEAAHNRAMQVMWSAAGAVAVAFILGGWLLGRSITKPLDRLRDVLGALVKHDYTRPVPDTGRGDEVGEMARAVAAVKQSLEAEWQAVIRLRELSVELAANASSLKQASSSLATAAEESSTQAATVSTAAREASSSVATVAAGSEEMTASIHEIAQNSTKAAGAADQATAQARAAAKTVGELQELSRHIDGVAQTIAAIAEQTNLLALNATIEAARAGDAGRGFAVVAGEVKELANQTRSATERIGSMIESVQSLSRAAESAMREIAVVVEQVSESQGSVAAAVEEQTATNREISRSISAAAQQAEMVSLEVAAFVEAAR